MFTVHSEAIIDGDSYGEITPEPDLEEAKCTAIGFMVEHAQNPGAESYVTDPDNRTVWYLLRNHYGELIGLAC